MQAPNHHAPLSSTLQLTVECNNLPKLDVFSASDPFVVISEFLVGSGKWHELRRTETKQDTNSPRFDTVVDVQYHFEEVQQLRFDVYDRDAPSDDLARHDFIGSASTTLADIACSRTRSVTQPLVSGNVVRTDSSGRQSQLVVKVEEVIQQTKDTVVVKMRGEKLKKMDFWGKSDAFVELHRMSEAGDSAVVFSSAVKKNTLNPDWGVKELGVSRICNGDLRRPLVARVLDWNRNGDTKLIGQCNFSLHALLEATLPAVFDLTHPNKPDKRNRGRLVFDSIVLNRRKSFMDYLQRGLRIELSVAIDFTASNGDPRDARSLHALSAARGGSNDYLQAIQSVGSVLQPYDADNMIAVYGFGAALPTTTYPVSGRAVSHCFPVSLDESRLEVRGVEGIVQAYINALQVVQLAGPTLFSQVIETFAAAASSPYSASSQHYHVLLIITDGVISDFQNTIDCIVTASRLPVSIVIVGVGNEDFARMDILDADDKVLKSSRGVEATRDIVQFVPYNKFRASPSRLAAHTLEEIPGQIEKYMWMNNIRTIGEVP